MTENKYYVYEHLRNDTGEVFYVGKGTGFRAKRRNRTKDWNQLVEEAGGHTIRFVATELSEDEAYQYEIDRISELLSNGTKLLNKSIGGRGAKGCKMPERGDEYRSNMSNAKKGHSVSEEARAKMSAWRTGKKFAKQSEELRAKRSLIMKEIWAKRKTNVSN